MAHSAGIHHAVTVYGNDWCGDTQRSLALLDSLEVAYNYYDLDKDAAMARTASELQNGGKKTPVIVVEEGTALVEPTDEELEAALHKSGHLA